MPVYMLLTCENEENEESERGVTTGRHRRAGVTRSALSAQVFLNTYSNRTNGESSTF